MTIRILLLLFANATKSFGCTNTDSDIEDLQSDNDELVNLSNKVTEM